MKINLQQIKKEIDAIIPDITRIRHHLHANPELSLQEKKTAEFIRNQVNALDVDVLPPFLSTDVVVLLNAGTGGKNITLRADMDALPIQEQNTFPYQSCHKNIMHACGHDGHTAMLLGAAKILERYKTLLNGSVRFVFQPGEEIVAAGRDLVEKGVLHDPKPDAVLALHGWPGYPLGAVCSRPGPMMAAADFFKITVKGKGGHGSKPELTKDPILTASRIINSLYLLSSRKFSSLESVVFSICKINGGSNANTIPDTVVMEGTARYFDKRIGDKMPGLFEQVIKQECDMFGADYELRYDRPYIPTVNDATIIKKCKAVVQNYGKELSWIDCVEPVMASEDFSYYIDKNPGAMFFLGMGEKSPGLHSNTFNFNDKALRNGILFLTLSTLALLEG